MTIGAIEGIEIGNSYESREELYKLGVHRALQAGIVGRGDEGAESIVLSGGYVDDKDFGLEIVYTGAGGRDQNSGRQVADQEFTQVNKALVTSCLEGLPVRVIRGSRHKSDFSPDSGYRYDGLFRVEDYWYDTGEHGHRICRFRLVSMEPQQSINPDAGGQLASSSKQPKRSETTIQRIVRDTALGRKVKEIHDFRCQVCGERLDCVAGPYAEAAHIRPLGEPHNGPDELPNLLCLCPNHHVLLDRGAVTIDDNFILEQTGEPLRTVKKHSLSQDHLRYQRGMWA